MSEQSQKVPWVSLIVAGVVAFVASFVISILIVTGYATVLAMQARGAPDQTQINAFANQYAPFFGPALLALAVTGAAYWAVRRAQAPQLWYGVVVALAAAIPSLFLGGLPALADFIGPVLGLGGGVLGAFLVMRK